jgi:hypothetical protein
MSLGAGGLVAKGFSVALRGYFTPIREPSIPEAGALSCHFYCTIKKNTPKSVLPQRTPLRTTVVGSVARLTQLPVISSGP